MPYTIEGLDVDNVSLTTINLVNLVTFSSKRSIDAGQYLEICALGWQQKRTAPHKQRRGSDIERLFFQIGRIESLNLSPTNGSQMYRSILTGI